MRSISDRGTDVLTVAHKLVGASWTLSAIAVLVLAVSAPDPSAQAWERVAGLQRLGAVASVATLLLGLAYGIWTVWGFLKSAWVAGKWVLFLVAAGTAGYAMRAATAHDSSALVTLTAVQLLALGAAIAVGVFLERSRHAGKLP
ncbi:MAG: hypothetical protein IBX62_06335 [Coriobacteriia bacterium]|nr:hypothetical protein [Coriobacteriia bacterium]